MRLVRHGKRGCERPGIVDGAGRILDLGDIVPDWDGSTLGAESLARVRSMADAKEFPVVPEGARLGPCVASPSKFVCVGLNYHAHIAEIGATAPAEPVLFMKAPSAVSGPNDEIVIPPAAEKVDWEVELGVVIGARATRVPERDALQYVAGYCVVNDISERAWQLEGTGQWVKGKSADTFAPLGPWLLTADEVADPQELALSLSLNGERQQEGHTSDMVFGVRYLLSFISRFMTLMPGDVVSTGTPPGVGMASKPPRFLHRGDVMEVSIEGLGTQVQRVASAGS